MAYEELEEKIQKFIDKYLNTLDATSSAIEGGFDRKNASKIGIDLLAREDIQQAISERREQLNNLTNSIKFEKEDLMRIYWDMFNDAKRKGKLADARAILTDIAKYNGVAPDEIKKEIAVLNFNLDSTKI